ncbi:hypothetical protein CKAH01_16117 [Colletotrichum kahawae]|uniref:Uncharacterized protein n=1 Tax=Colletotrichum kahawae TaxID=34407 RepID=A0AAE0D5Y1_COLKA|nr:hypothetical protein CKAH01_16117 [Colletotrichum kahawae]
MALTVGAIRRAAERARRALAPAAAGFPRRRLDRRQRHVNPLFLGAVSEPLALEQLSGARLELLAKRQALPNWGVTSQWEAQTIFGEFHLWTKDNSEAAGRQDELVDRANSIPQRSFSPLGSHVPTLSIYFAGALLPS